MGGNEKGGKDLTFHLFCPEIKMLAGMYEILLRIKMTMTNTMMMAWVGVSEFVGTQFFSGTDTYFRYQIFVILVPVLIFGNFFCT